MKEVYMKSIRRVGVMPTRCISLDNEEGLYITDDDIVTHNSLLSVLVLTYLATTFANFIAPWKLLGHSPATQYVLAMGCNTLGRASQLILEPFESLMDNSPFFEKVKRRDELDKISAEDPGLTKLYYTGASRSSDFELRNHLKVKRMNDPFGLIGLTIVAGTLTEIGWFKDSGWSDERIFKFFTDLQERISNRMGGNYMGRVIIDSSPYSLESPIDEWIWSKAPKNHENYIVTGSRWKHYPQEFPDYCKYDEKTGLYVPVEQFGPGFQMFLGNEKEPPTVIENAIAASKYDTVDLIWCPTLQQTPRGQKNFLMLAKENPFTFLRNFAGIPSGTSDRIFTNPMVIDDVFNNDLLNIYNSITAYPDDEPEELIWKKVRDQLFTEINGKYFFYRESSLPRAVSVDQSYGAEGDATGIAIGHTEYKKDVDIDGTPVIKTVYVMDATIVIIPNGTGVSLDAIRSFIFDLVNKGNMNIKYVSFDSFQSVPTRQALNRAGIECEYVSVDKDTGNENYVRLVDMVQHGRLKAGRNIHLKNNLKSIRIAKRKSGTIKYDHTNGDPVHVSEDMNWETSKIGIHAKDALDAVCACVSLLANHDKDFPPLTEWRDSTASGIESINDELAKRGLKI